MLNLEDVQALYRRHQEVAEDFFGMTEREFVAELVRAEVAQSLALAKLRGEDPFLSEEQQSDPYRTTPFSPDDLARIDREVEEALAWARRIAAEPSKLPEAGAPSYSFAPNVAWGE